MNKSFLPNWLYDVLSWIALIALDAIGVAYEQLAGVWNLPYGTEVLKTCAIFSVLLGTLIGVSKAHYNTKKNKKTKTEE